MGVTAMKRNILCILLLFGIVVCMTGCNINNIFKTEEEKNDEKCQQIIMAIENHDADALKGLFQKQLFMKQAISARDVIIFFQNTTERLSLLKGQDTQVTPIMNRENMPEKLIVNMR